MKEQEIMFIDNSIPFVYMEDTLNALNVAYNTNKNIVLYGRGGFGKSEVVKYFLSTKGIENPFTQVMGSGTTVEKLYGGVNVSNFIGDNPTGKIEYLTENSFLEHEVVIFEELFDARDIVLESLKHTLSSGYLMNGSQIVPVKTKVIFCCTNRTREEFAKDNSIKALLERFPLEKEVKWEDYGCLNYDKLFINTFGYTNSLVSYICGEYAKKGRIISPRIALTTFDIVERTSDPQNISLIADFISDKNLFKKVIHDYTIFADIQAIKDSLESIVREYTEYVSVNQVHDKNILKGYIKQLTDLNLKVGKLKSTDNVVADIETIKKVLDETTNAIEKDFTVLTSVLL